MLTNSQYWVKIETFFGVHIIFHFFKELSCYVSGFRFLFIRRFWKLNNVFNVGDYSPCRHVFKFYSEFRAKLLHKLCTLPHRKRVYSWNSRTGFQLCEFFLISFCFGFFEFFEFNFLPVFFSLLYFQPLLLVDDGRLMRILGHLI